jgi:hypothetical protein
VQDLNTNHRSRYISLPHTSKTYLYDRPNPTHFASELEILTTALSPSPPHDKAEAKHGDNINHPFRLSVLPHSFGDAHCPLAALAAASKGPFAAPAHPAAARPDADAHHRCVCAGDGASAANASTRTEGRLAHR